MITNYLYASVIIKMGNSHEEFFIDEEINKHALVLEGGGSNYGKI
jgi:hypothetical protein